MYVRSCLPRVLQPVALLLGTAALYLAFSIGLQRIKAPADAWELAVGQLQVSGQKASNAGKGFQGSDEPQALPALPSQQVDQRLRSVLPGDGASAAPQPADQGPSFHATPEARLTPVAYDTAPGPATAPQHLQDNKAVELSPDTAVPAVALLGLAPQQSSTATIPAAPAPAQLNFSITPDDDALLPPGAKYYMHELTNGGIDDCVGWNNVQGSLGCAMAEAKALGRVFIMPYLYCVPPMHQPDGIGMHFPFPELADFGCFLEPFPFLFRSNFTRVLGTARAQGLVVAEPVGPHQLPSTLVDHPADVIIRLRGEGWWLIPCFEDAQDPNSLHLEELRWTIPFQPAPALVAIAEQLWMSLGDYDALHVRRGDKLKETDKFPDLDQETRPEPILQAIAPRCAPGRKLYILSNEPDPDFFAPLAAVYEVFCWRNWTQLLLDAGIVADALYTADRTATLPCHSTRYGTAHSASEVAAGPMPQTSEALPACNEVRVVNNMLLYSVEKLVQQHAQLSLETFNDLSSVWLDAYGIPMVH